MIADPASTDALSPAKRARLVAFLGGLPPGPAGKLFAALETDRARGGAALPHDALLDILRAELVAREGKFPPRQRNAERVFFTPFEDFFVAFRTGRKRKGRIARSSLTPLWRILKTDPAASGAARAASALDGAIRENSPNLPTFEEALFLAAAEGFGRLLAHAEADTAFRADLIDRLGGPDGFDDFREISRLIGAVHHLRSLQAAFARPVRSLTEEDLYEMRRLYVAARADIGDAAPYLLLQLMGRMEGPWRALRLYYHLTSAEDGALGPAREESAIILDTLFDDLEGAARLLERDCEGDFDAAIAETHLSHFIAFAEGLSEEAGRAGDRVVQNRVEAARDVAAGALERFTEQALASLRRAMPVRHAGGSSRLMALRPDCSRPMPPRVVAAARQATAFRAKAAGLAARLRRPQAGKNVAADAAEEARRYAGDLVLEIRAAEGEDRVAARRLMEAVLEFGAPLLQADEVGLLRERAQAAALTA
ncbi:MAG: hypothetical protein HXY23_13570 [Parvularculaceae bacterium]|nr:hypothetical protein [Parvularculaceae bacterium]